MSLESFRIEGKVFEIGLLRLGRAHVLNLLIYVITLLIWFKAIIAFKIKIVYKL